MNRLFQQKFGKLLRPRDGDPPRGAAPRTSSVIIALMIVLLVIGGLAHVFTALSHG